MSEVAKDRLLAVGARFSSYEQANAMNNEQVLSTTGSPPGTSQATSAQTSGKMSFWKKNTSKVPGRPVYGAQHPPLQATDAHLSTYIKGGKLTRNKPETSFQEFEGSTLDAWDETEDDPLKVMRCSPPGNDPEAPHVGSLSTDLIEPLQREGPEKSELERPPLSAISSSEDISRHPAPAATSLSSTHNSNPLSSHGATPKAADCSRATTMKQALVSKLKIGKNNRGKSTPSPPALQNEGPELMSAPQPHSPIRQMKPEFDDQENSRMERFGKLLAGPVTDLDQLRKLSWNGIPHALRGSTWRLLSGYLPPSIDRRQATLERKQAEYHGFVERYYSTRFDDLHQETFRQIHIDIPRTNPLIPIFQQQVVQELFERILFIWAIRHPASGYVQGINDLVVPFFVVFLSEHVDKAVETCNVEKVSKEVLDAVEADSFWCLSKLLDGIQDNYTFAQPGIQMKINTLRDLVSRINDRLHQHILAENIDYLQFTFRWMNNLLMRELPLRCSIRLWDTYWSETDGFASFHLYVCAALLTMFKKEILEKLDFQSLMVFLQNMPCQDWTDDDVSCLVAEAYRLQFVFADAPKHLRSGR